jgi:methyl-accepting chemotaxis protein
MLKKLTVKTQLSALIALVLVLLALFVLIVRTAVNTMEVSANEMGKGKDVVADILPPPLFIIEAQLTALELQHASPDVVPALVSHLSTLKEQYDQRNEYWVATELVSEVKDSLLGPQKVAADRFWSLLLGEYIPAIKSGDSAAISQTYAEVKRAFDAHRRGVDNTVTLANTYAGTTFAMLEETATNIRTNMAIIALIGMVAVAFVMMLVLREIMRRLGGEPLEIQSAAKCMAEGDLTAELRNVGGDQDSLMASIVQLQKNLLAIISESRRVATQLTESAGSMAGAASQVAAGSTRQSDASSTMAAAIEQITVSMGHVAGNAGGAKVLAEKNRQLTLDGRSLMQGLIHEINLIAETVNMSGSVVQELGTQSSRISSIVQVIKDIADQTNLLALNAAIEAARAGDQGRGFAVVADEVRGLAARTAQSTQEISTMIQAIQQGTQKAVQAMGQGRERVDAGVEMASKTIQAVEDIESGTGSLLNAVGEISNALSEQTTASSELAESLELIAQMSNQNCTSVQSLHESATELEKMARSLDLSVGRFKLVS